MKYKCENCDFRSDDWATTRNHAFNNTNHSVCRTDETAMNTRDNPV